MTKAIIIGGGIGGLTAAAALGRAGVEVAVFERAPELKEIGAGISLWANATRALARCLGDGISASLRRYEELRIGRTSAVVRSSRLAGTVTQMENPLLCRLRDEVAKRVSARARLWQYEKIARYRV